MLEHPLRRQVVSEMHLRRWPSFALPCLILQWVRVAAASVLDDEALIIARAAGASCEAAAVPHFSGILEGNITFAWERHSEGSTVTIFYEPLDELDLLESLAIPALLAAIAWGESLPGAVLRATRIWAVESDEIVGRVLPALQFCQDELVSCHLKGQARLWSDFRLQDDGYGQLVVASNGVDISDFTRLVHRLQELGNYRNRALLGLPVAKQNWPLLDRIEVRLQELADIIVSGTDTDDSLHAQLSRLSLDLMAISTAVNYRMSATAAYAVLVDERLQDLDCSPIPGFASLADFTQRRFLPAVRTCAALTARERQLSQRAGQITSLLRTRIETRIENQNAHLLRSMEQSSSMQLRLQQLVEGLSVVALSYYLLGLVTYGLKGFGNGYSGIDPDRIIAWLILPTLIGTWLALQFAKRRLIH